MKGQEKAAAVKGMCKNHPEVEAVMRKDGVSTGRCAGCLRERGEAMRAAAGGKGKKGMKGTKE